MTAIERTCSHTEIPGLPTETRGLGSSGGTTSASSRCTRFIKAESILLRFWFFGEFEEVSSDVFKDFSNLCGGGVKEFTPRIDAVDAFGCEAVVQLSFDAYGIVGEEQGVDIEVEWHGRISEFTNTIHGVKAACHTDLDHTLAEGPDVRDDIDISSAAIGLPFYDIVNSLFDLSELLAQLLRFSTVAGLLNGFEDIEVVLAFFFETFTFGPELLLSARLFT